MDYPGKVITKTQVTPTQTSASGNWTLDDQAAAIKNNNWPVALVPNPISKSLRFNSADSAYVSRTPTSNSTSQTTRTFSAWVKRSALANASLFYQGVSGGTGQIFYILFSSNSIVVWYDATPTYSVTTSAVFRDPSAWYHIVVSSDTTQATTANRTKIYVNGVEQTITGTQPTQNYTAVNGTTSVHYIGGIFAYYSGYLTEVNFIDGQALTPSDFGLTNPQTGQWIPKKYTGTYGTNGFYLNFKDATSTTTLGYDYSGNANNWTTNNFSVTAGVGNDSLTDVPTPWVAYNTTGDVGGVVRGNYATLNSVDRTSDTDFVLSNGNLTATTTNNAAAWLGIRATIACPTGKWYWEVSSSNATTSTSTYQAYIIGLAQQNTDLNVNPVGASQNTYGYINYSGIKFQNNTTASYGATFAANDVVGIAFDVTNGTLEFYKNGVSQGTAYTGITGTYFPMLFQYSNTASSVDTSFNFGQRPFAYTPPAGFRSLCTTNLPATTIGFGLTNQADDYFNTVLYTGNGVAIGSGGQTITGVGFQSDFTWIKSRSNAFSHRLIDVVRGAPLELISESTAAETNRTEGLNNWTSDGFVVGNASGYNQNTSTFVAWNWKAGGTGVTNTAGTVTSTVSANTTARFSVVTYTGTGVAATVGHGLGVAPSMIIVKDRDDAGTNWCVYHVSLGNGNRVLLNLTNASAATGNWNSTSPTSSVFSIGVSSEVSANNKQHVAYCFAAVAGYSAFGSYTGNGSTDGPFVYLGFRPRFLLLKISSTTGDWAIYDTSRNTYNVMDLYLYPNSSAAEGGSGTPRVDALSNGFKLRNLGQDNTSSATYIYAAFAEFPFQFANAR